MVGEGGSNGCVVRRMAASRACSPAAASGDTTRRPLPSLAPHQPPATPHLKLFPYLERAKNSPLQLLCVPCILFLTRLSPFAISDLQSCNLWVGLPTLWNSGSLQTFLNRYSSIIAIIVVKHVWKVFLYPHIRFVRALLYNSWFLDKILFFYWWLWIRLRFYV